MAAQADDPLRRIKTLRKLIAAHDGLYFDQDEPQISDEEYDARYAELVELERQHPQYRDVALADHARWRLVFAEFCAGYP